MGATKPVGADHFLPDNRGLESLAEAAAGCQGCSLHEAASQTVFGYGRHDATFMLVGEQPGDREDLEGRPFVGPAGRLLARALADAQIDLRKTYQTNAVKHFKFTRKSGKRRIHQKPNRTEVVACRPWLLAEIAAVQPSAIVLLGATAAQALLGNTFRISERRGELLAVPDEITADPAPLLSATAHPSAVLRDPVDRDAAYRRLVADLRAVRDELVSD